MLRFAAQHVLDVGCLPVLESTGEGDQLAQMNEVSGGRVAKGTSPAEHALRQEWPARNDWRRLQLLQQ
jgi:hypothetical protein